MATRGKSDASGEVWGAVPAGAVPPSTDDDADTEQSPIERVMVALAETADPTARARLILYRVMPGQAGKPERLEYCIDLQPAEFEAEGLGGIREVWGPGTYEVRLMGHKKGSPHFVRLAAPRFILAPVPSQVARSPESSGALAGIESAMRSMAESQARLIEALAESRAVPVVNPVAQLQETLGLMTAMREAMGLNQHPAQRQEKSSIAEIVEAIKELKEVSSLVNPDSQPEKSDLENIVEMAKPLVGIVTQAISSQQRAVNPVRIPAQFSRGIENGNTTESMVAGVGSQQFRGISNPRDDASSTASSSADNVNGSPNILADEAEVSNVVGDASGGQEVAEKSETEVLSELHGYLVTLVSFAESGESAEKGAELVYDKLPDEWIELLHMPIWWDALKTAAPQFEKHEAWVRAVRDRVVEMFAEDENDVANQQIAAKGA